MLTLTCPKQLLIPLTALTPTFFHRLPNLQFLSVLGCTCPESISQSSLIQKKEILKLSLTKTWSLHLFVSFDNLKILFFCKIFSQNCHSASSYAVFYYLLNETKCQPATNLWRPSNWMPPSTFIRENTLGLFPSHEGISCFLFSSKNRKLLLLY